MAPRVETSSGFKGDQEFPNCHSAAPPASYLIAVTTEQVLLAGREPNRGGPLYAVLYPGGNPAEVNHGPVSNPKNFWRKAANDGWGQEREWIHSQPRSRRQEPHL